LRATRSLFVCAWCLESRLGPIRRDLNLSPTLAQRGPPLFTTVAKAATNRTAPNLVGHFCSQPDPLSRQGHYTTHPFIRAPSVQNHGTQLFPAASFRQVADFIQFCPPDPHFLFTVAHRRNSPLMCVALAITCNDGSTHVALAGSLSPRVVSLSAPVPPTPAIGEFLFSEVRPSLDLDAPGTEVHRFHALVTFPPRYRSMVSLLKLTKPGIVSPVPPTATTLVALGPLILRVAAFYFVSLAAFPPPRSLFSCDAPTLSHTASRCTGAPLFCNICIPTGPSFRWWFSLEGCCLLGFWSRPFGAVLVCAG